MKKVNMDSLLIVMAELEKQGFTSELEVNGKRLISLKTNNHYSADQLKITRFYRFKGESNPEHSAIMYELKPLIKKKEHWWMLMELLPIELLQISCPG